MASGTFYDTWGPTGTVKGYSNRYHQNHLKVTWSSDNSQVTYTINAYARSGNGSGSYYASGYGVTVTLYYKLNNGNWISLGSASGTLNYNNNVADITKTVTINRTTTSQTIQFGAWNTGSSLNEAWHTTGNDTISALASYTVSYNANGGSGAPGNQTKYYGQDLILSDVAPSRSNSTQNGYTVIFNSNGAGYANVSVTAKNTIRYTFADKWNTNSAGTGTEYAKNGTYKGNAALTLYAQWNPQSSLGSVSIPTEMKKRDGYTFLGWKTDLTATAYTVTAAATTYTPDGNKTLYAIWKQNYVPVSLTNIKAIRVNTPASTIPADEGTVGYITVNWTKGHMDDNTEHNAEKILYSYTSYGETVTTGTITISSDITTTSFWIDNLSIDKSWNITATTVDSHDNTESSKTTLLSPAFFTMDILKGGRGVAFGKPATEAILDIALPTKITNTTTTALNIDGNTTINGTLTLNNYPVDFRYFGTPVNTTTTDTTQTWNELGSGLTWYNTAGQLNGQPSQYGLMLNMTSGHDVAQIWKEQRDGGLYIRGGNSSYGFMGWHLIPYVSVFYATSGSATITLLRDTRHLIISAHNSTPELNGIALVTGSTVWKIAGGSYITYTHSGTTVTATSTQGGNPAYYLIPLE